MARGKKKEAALSPAERLQAALVPESEQPYKVPENWCWVRLGSLGYTNIGLTYKPSDKSETGTIVLRSSNIQDGKIDYSDIVRVNINIPENKMSQKGDILICARNGSKALVGKTALIDKDGMSYGAFMAIFRSRYNKIIFCYLNSPYFRDIIDRDVGTSTINQVTQNLIKELPFPLPPLFEQQRIVERIESLFAKLDEAKQKAQDALDSFETRKAAILHRAFTGELTAQWRKEHGVGMESWKNSTVGRACRDVKVGIVIKPSQYYTDKEEGTPAFRSANVRENHIDDFDWVYLNRAGMENNSRSIVHTGDVLVVRSGNPGTACVVSERFDGYNAIDILIAVPDHKQISSEFLCNYTNSPFGKTLILENKRGMALAHFNVKGYSELPIRVPELDEQTEIVRILDNLLAKEQQAKEAAEKALEQIDLTKKAILARAFRGELGTNDPSEKSAVELIKQLIKE